jgi:outer membrane protein OmpA-like peptidoglycan-associated protein
VAARLLAIVKSKAFIIAALLIAGYLLAGFALVPYLVSHYLPEYVKMELHRQASIGKVRFNPFLFTFEVNDFALEEADGRPIASFKHLFVDFELESLFRRAWIFGDIVLEQPSVLAEIGPDRLMNLAAVAESFPKSEEPQAPTSAPVRVMLRHVALKDGHFTFSDRSKPKPASVTLEPLDLELTDLSTLPAQRAPYAIKADLLGGGKLTWSGEISLQPVNSTGRLELKGLRLAAAWSFLRDQLNLEEPAGALDLQANYRFTLADGTPQLALEDIGVAIHELALRLSGENEPILALAASNLEAGRFDWNARELSLGEVEIGPGSARAEVDDTGMLNWRKLTRAEQGKPAPAATTEPASPWKISLPSVRLARIGLHYSDASRARPVRLDVGAIDLGFAAQMETGTDGLAGSVREGTMGLANVEASESAAQAPLMNAERLAISDLTVDLGKHDAHLGRIVLTDGNLRVIREADGRIGLLEFVSPQDREQIARKVVEVQKAAEAEGKPWRLGLDVVELDRFTLAVTDHGIEPAANIDVIVKRLAATDIHTDGKTRMGFQAALAVQEGGSIDAEGGFAANTGKADARLKIANLSLMPIEPYVARFTTLKLASGHISTAGTLAYERGEPQPRVSYQGTLNIANLLLKEAAGGQRFLGWRSLDALGVKFGLAPDLLQVAEVRLSQPEAKVVVFEDRTVNLGKVLREPKTRKQAKTAPAKSKLAPARGKPAASADATFPVNVQRVRIDKGEVDFADLSLVIPFATHVRELIGSVNGISSAPSSRAQIQLEGRVEQYGLARVFGSLEPLQPRRFTDISVIFRNVQMKPLTPYSATFAGRKIASGALNLDLQYKIQNGQLAGENKVVLDQFTLGERVESPRAVDLPLDLAIALLTDSQGKIDVAVPVHGDLNEPRFKYGEVIWQAIVNIIKNTVTAPFRALGKVFDGDTEALSAIAFDPGSDQLLPPEQQKLAKLAEGMKQRAQLKLQVQGRFDDKLDGEAIRELRVRLALAARLGVTLAPGENPGPVAFDNAATQGALERLLEARSGSGAVGALQAEQERSTGAKTRRVNPALALLGRASPDTAFYQALFARLVASEPLPATDLAGLAERRAKAIVGALKGFGVEATRLAVLTAAPAEEATAEGVHSTLALTTLESGS